MVAPWWILASLFKSPQQLEAESLALAISSMLYAVQPRSEYGFAAPIGSYSSGSIGSGRVC